MAIITRVSTYAMHQTTLTDVLKTQSRLANLQNQVSSGFKTDNFQGMDGQVEAFIQFEAKLKKTQTLINNNTLIIARMQSTETAITQIVDIAEDFQKLMVQRLNPVSGEALQFDVSARAMLETIANQLNASQEGRYLFGGTRTDIPPVKSPIPASQVPGIPDDLYYQGNNTDLYARVQENFDLRYNVRANEEGFQKLFAAIHLGLQANSTNSTTLLQDAAEMAEEALREVVSIRARVQQNIVNVEEINSRHEQQNLYWKGLSERIIKTDVLAASTEIALSQVILSASFQSFTTLNQLRLVDFLR